MNINSQQLRYFMELADCLNFTRAAANLYVAQPTLSQQIAELESQLGVSLFTRSSRSVSLTPAGLILYKALPDIQDQMLQVQQRMLVIAAGFSGTLNVGFLNIFMDTMPRIMRYFQELYPDIAIRPVCATQNEITKGLKNGSIDVAFSLTRNFTEEDTGFDSRLITSDDLCFVLPANHPQPPEGTCPESFPLITWCESIASGYSSYVTDCLKTQEIQVSKTLYADSLENLRAYLESGIGFSVLSRKYAAFFSDSTKFLPIPGEHLGFGVLWSDGSSSPTIPLFLDALDQFLNPEPEAPILGRPPRIAM